MKTSVVISQPMFFPWAGMLEQMRLADVFVHYDDVQFSKGSFTNRVQIKTAQGSRWLTVPLSGVSLGTAIRDVGIDSRKDWRRTHRETLFQAYAHAPYRSDMMAVVEEVYAREEASMSELAIASMMAVHRYFGFPKPVKFHDSSQLGIGGSGSQRVLDVVRHLDGDLYITGHGARHYLDHELFERSGVQVEYLDYQRHPYPQLHGPFDPHVSSLDLIANCGRQGREVLTSPSVPWRQFLAKMAGSAG